MYYICIYFVYLTKHVCHRSRTPSSLCSTFIVMLRDIEIRCEDSDWHGAWSSAPQPSLRVLWVNSISNPVMVTVDVDSSELRVTCTSIEALKTTINGLHHTVQHLLETVPDHHPTDPASINSVRRTLKQASRTYNTASRTLSGYYCELCLSRPLHTEWTCAKKRCHDRCSTGHGRAWEWPAVTRSLSSDVLGLAPQHHNCLWRHRRQYPVRTLWLGAGLRKCLAIICRIQKEYLSAWKILMFVTIYAG